jgi:uncharacterized membrane protein YidH (DUF202 family)
MSPRNQARQTREKATPSILQYSAWFLCGLLILFCANARMARYVKWQRSSKLITAQTYLDSGEIRLPASVVALLLLFCIPFATVSRRNVATASRNSCLLPLAVRADAFDREFHIRPPPRV